MGERENVFDENGATVETMEADAAANGENTPETAAEGENTPEEGKFRIGDRTFTTESEALTFAQAQVANLEAERQVSDAYQQGLRDAQARAGVSPENVTPPAPIPVDTEKFYTDPQGFLTDYAKKIQAETLSTIDRQRASAAEDEQIWREFSHKHPQLADFRGEVERYTNDNAKTVRGLVATKGRDAAYDYIATQLKVQFGRYGEAIKPVRELPNARGAAAQGAKGGNVTPPAASKKPLSFTEQIRQYKKGKA